ncbi:hypothetical protein A2862_03280 [Candidatus Roizmanbacteria bacterium RIFCSPHIGHO2_01_FULL_38_41]|uniref:SLC41A/MgtE integral membrane domain-containing protein n=1 Tax=Candidatus Roizmanbacteria bacterium RIFCSPHIGHO2_02_FULL_37_24 TaxID=1802037 RepID=A0A1F7GTS6_9BACT|nr:MAG: hypothetical protein A2862_03280 [Candidatus Roizmanbacteria bacterium RIFCSPHIGHO2_01_FULL_38_41]OGK22457.1 MAG: hypothetical protein A3C24_03995 [Candidatus Roizmanbacteria bacterium RIFCSPHIGHO2_02_FULL_37_24]OGK33115.1 MAG: hypothetical protein A3E10_00915 [Candidatus Roizmanbacteria bacterium RIFCSPHIGHO2_12_FULL_37_23]OGK43436.1 MAG: hypothetical protein A2956_02515 [Candidatus Roizmanbacteria bacterium RIFCSPLOWO2_01_FULL_37_57]OGK61428.1 MAG: hypothetical protein A3G65_00230 [Ca
MFGRKKVVIADDDMFSVRKLVEMRIPSLFIGLLLGFMLSFATARFEAVLVKNIQIVYFLPFIVYMADAVGTQTQTIYARDLSRGKAKFTTYLVKEILLGITIGIIFGMISWLVVTWWFNSAPLALAVALGMFGAISTAPLVGLIVTEALQIEHQDPAIGAGPIATVIQDLISVLLYGLICSAVILG